MPIVIAATGIAFVDTTIDTIDVIAHIARRWRVLSRRHM